MSNRFDQNLPPMLRDLHTDWPLLNRRKQMIGKLGNQPLVPQTKVEEMPNTGLENAKQNTAQSTQEDVTTSKTETFSATRTGDYMMSGQMNRLFLEGLLSEKVSSQPQGPKPPAGPNDILAKGSYGPEVSKLQQDLNTWRMENGKEPIKVDGNFGPATESALKEYQASLGIKADGLAGPNTKAQLEVNAMPLDPEVKAQIRYDLAQYENYPEARENLMKEVRDPNFQTLPSESQGSALFELAKNPSDPTHATNVLNATKESVKMEMDSQFQNLDPATKKLARFEMFKFADHPGGTFNLSGLFTDPAFGRLTPEQQNRVMNTVNSNNPDQAPTLRAMMNSLSFQGMDEGTRTYVLSLANSNAKDYDATVRMIGLLNDPAFVAAPKEEQWNQLKQFDKDPEPEIYR
jgi:Putative peptidoglycan binding domain